MTLAKTRLSKARLRALALKLQRAFQSDFVKINEVVDEAWIGVARVALQELTGSKSTRERKRPRVCSITGHGKRVCG